MPRAGVNTAEEVAFGAELADETGIGPVSPVPLTERQDVKTPALSKHIDGIRDLQLRIATVAIADLSDAMRDALEGRSRADATMRSLHDLPERHS